MWAPIGLGGASRVSMVKWRVSMQDGFGNMLFDCL